MSFDVLGIGCVAVDDVLFVESYPGPDRKVRATRRERRFGGLTGAALIAAARMGARCAYAGRLGCDELSALVAANLERERIDTSLAARTPAAQPVYSTIVVAANGTRNVFSHVGGVTGADESLPETAIRGARVLLLDHHGIPGAIRAATIAREAGVAVLADLERDDDPRFDEILALVDHLILPSRFACRITGTESAPEAVRALWRDDRSVVIVTLGAQGCWHASSRHEEPRHFPAFEVEARNTTGCGDVFHGAYAAALAAGWPLAERMRVAAAAAALNAKSGAPSREEVDAFLAAREAAS